MRKNKNQKFIKTSKKIRNISFLLFGLILMLSLCSWGAINNANFTSQFKNNSVQVENKQPTNESSSPTSPSKVSPAQPSDQASSSQSLGATASGDAYPTKDMDAFFTITDNPFKTTSEAINWYKELRQTSSSPNLPPELHNLYNKTTPFQAPFRKWVKYMVFNPIEQAKNQAEETKMRNEYFQDGGKPPNKETQNLIKLLNGIKELKDDQAEVNLSWPASSPTPYRVINLAARTNTGKTIPKDPGQAIEIAQFKASDKGILALDFTREAGGTIKPEEKNVHLVIDNRNGELGTLAVGKMISDGKIFMRVSESKYDPNKQVSSNQNLVEIAPKDPSGLIKIYSFIKSNETIKVSKSIGLGNSKIASEKFGVLDIYNVNNSGKPMTDITQIPVYTEQIEPIVPTDPSATDISTIEFYLRKGESIHMIASAMVDGNPVEVSPDFAIKYDAKDGKVKQQISQTGTSQQGSQGTLSIDDKLVPPDARSDKIKNFSTKMEVQKSADDNFVKVTFSYRPKFLSFKNSVGVINLDEPERENGNKFFAGVYFESPLVNFNTKVTTTNIKPEFATNPDTIARLALGKVLQTWASQANSKGITLPVPPLALDPKKEYPVTYNEVTAGQSEGNFKIQDEAKTHQLTGAKLYNTLIDQSKTIHEAITFMNTNAKPRDKLPYIHGKTEKDTDYYQLKNIGPPTLIEYLQTKILEFSPSTSSIFDNLVNSWLIDGKTNKPHWNSVDNIPLDEYAQVAGALKDMMTTVIQDTFNKFQDLLFKRVYAMYGDSLWTNRNQHADTAEVKVVPDKILNVVQGDIGKGDALFSTGDYAPQTKTTAVWNKDVIGSLIHFIKRNNLGALIFSGHEGLLKDFNHYQAEDFVDDVIFAKPGTSGVPNDQKEKEEQLFGVLSYLMRWLGVSGTNITNLVLKKNIDEDKIAQEFRDNAVKAVNNLMDRNKGIRQSETILGQKYSAPLMEILVTNADIFNTLNSIDTKGKSARYITGLSIVKKGEWMNTSSSYEPNAGAALGSGITRSKKFAIATENYNLDKYIKYFSNGKRTIEFSDQIKKLDFSKTNLFKEPKATPFVQKLLKSIALIAAVVSFLAVLGFGAIAVISSGKRRSISKSSIVGDKRNRWIIFAAIGVMLVLSVVLIAVFGLGFAGVIALPFAT